MEGPNQEEESPLRAPGIGADDDWSLHSHLRSRYGREHFPALSKAETRWNALGHRNISAIVRRLLRDPQGVTTVPLFRRQRAQKRAFRPRQIAWLLANAFCGNVGEFEVAGQKYGSLDFETLFCSFQPVAEERLLCLLDYFANCEAHFDDVDDIVFERCVFTTWPWKDETQCSANHVHVHTGPMEGPETEHGAAFVDFANKNLQIHRMIPSLTQEEVLFSVASACIVTLCCVDTLEDNESFAMHNVWR
jgi:hypothetical protein